MCVRHMQGGNTVSTTLFSCYIVRISYQIMRISYHVVRVSYRIAILRLPGFPFSNVFCVYQFYHLLCFAFIMFIMYIVYQIFREYRVSCIFGNYWDDKNLENAVSVLCFVQEAIFWIVEKQLVTIEGEHKVGDYYVQEELLVCPEMTKFYDDVTRSRLDSL